MKAFWHRGHFALFLPPIGRVAQLNRALRQLSELVNGLKIIGPVAQLNRASDYGSEGFRFES